MATGTLSGNSCSGYGAPATITGTTSQTVASGHCYLLTLTGTDNVGNAASITTTVKVDTTAPSAPTGFSFSGLHQRYYPGAGTTVYFKGGAAGGFTALASGATDADTGHRLLQLRRHRRQRLGQTPPAPTPSPPPPPAAAPRSPPPTTQASPAPSTSFTATADSTAPAGGAFTANSIAATGGGSSSYLNSGTTLTINSRTDYTDGGSGLASSTLTMATGNAVGQQLQRLRRTGHDRRHHLADRRQRPLLPAHPHRHRQRRQHRPDHHHRHGRHHRPERTRPASASAR